MTTKPKPEIKLKDLLFMPWGCLIHSSPLVILLLLLTGIFASDFIYYNLNINLPGYRPPEFSTWQISSGFNQIQDDKGKLWQITYEKDNNSQFVGLVRHVSPIRENMYPILSHDILITSGDFSNPDLVRVSVNNHSFRWGIHAGDHPQGNINLLHTVPYNEEVRDALFQIKSGDMVRITGREIFDILYFKSIVDASWSSKWKDNGCNTLLVTSVEILN